MFIFQVEPGFIQPYYLSAIGIMIFIKLTKFLSEIIMVNGPGKIMRFITKATHMDTTMENIKNLLWNDRTNFLNNIIAYLQNVKRSFPNSKFGSRFL